MRACVFCCCSPDFLLALSLQEDGASPPHHASASVTAPSHPPLHVAQSAPDGLEAYRGPQIMPPSAAPSVHRASSMPEYQDEDAELALALEASRAEAEAAKWRGEGLVHHLVHTYSSVKVCDHGQASVMLTTAIIVTFRVFLCIIFAVM